MTSRETKGRKAAAAPGERPGPADAVRVPAQRRHAVGVDLAWGDRNATGLAHLVEGDEGWRLTETTTVVPMEGILSWISSRVPRAAPAWIAVDAPLLATNPEGTQREADVALAADLRRFRAGTLRVDHTHATRGTALREGLVGEGFQFAPPDLSTGAPMRGLVETFPTAASLGLFGLRRPIGYKSGDRERRQERLRTLQTHVATLDDAALRLEPTTPLRALLATDPRGLAGPKLKALEDRLDALLCALVAMLCWSAPGRLVTYGDPERGFITLPHPPPGPEFV